LEDKKLVDKNIKRELVKENNNMNCSLAKIQDELREINYQFKTSRSLVSDIDNPP